MELTQYYVRFMDIMSSTSQSNSYNEIKLKNKRERKPLVRNKSDNSYLEGHVRKIGK